MPKTNTAEKLGLFLNQVKKKCVRELARAGKDTIQENIKPSLPKVTGSFAKSYHNVRKTAKINTDVLIGRFTNAAAEVLEHGVNSPYYSALGYPRFISFDEQPNLKKWVMMKKTLSKAKRESFLKRGGVMVGSPTIRSKGGKVSGGTRFGIGRNKWFTITMRKFRKNFRRKGIEYLRRIEMNKSYIVGK